MALSPMALAPNAVDFRNERRQVGCNIISDRCEMDGRDWSAIDHLTVGGMDVCSMIVQAHAITGSRYSRITITQECYISGSHSNMVRRDPPQWWRISHIRHQTLYCLARERWGIVVKADSGWARVQYDWGWMLMARLFRGREGGQMVHHSGVRTT